MLWIGWFSGKHLSKMCRHFLPSLVLTFELKGELYHVMFLVRFLLFFRACSRGGLYTHSHIFINPIKKRTLSVAMGKSMAKVDD